MRLFRELNSISESQWKPQASLVPHRPWTNPVPAKWTLLLRLAVAHVCDVVCWCTKLCWCSFEEKFALVVFENFSAALMIKNSISPETGGYRDQYQESPYEVAGHYWQVSTESVMAQSPVNIDQTLSLFLFYLLCSMMLGWWVPALFTHHLGFTIDLL